MDKRAKQRAAIERGTWLTRDYVVALSDGSAKRCYAISQEQANERIARWLVRAGDSRTVV